MLSQATMAPKNKRGGRRQGWIYLGIYKENRKRCTKRTPNCDTPTTGQDRAFVAAGYSVFRSALLILFHTWNSLRHRPRLGGCMQALEDEINIWRVLDDIQLLLPTL